MSEQVERRLLELLGHPTESPYGNPIPGLDEIGGNSAGSFEEGVVGLVTLMNQSEGPVSGVVRRLAEPAQVDPELLQQLRDAGVVPGAAGTFRFNEGYVLIEIEGQNEGLELPVELASHIFVLDSAN